MSDYRLTDPVFTIPCDQVAASVITASKLNYATMLNLAPNGVEVFRIEADGRLFWKDREVESDDELRAAMLEIKRYLTKGTA